MYISHAPDIWSKSSKAFLSYVVASQSAAAIAGKVLMTEGVRDGAGRLSVSQVIWQQFAENCHQEGDAQPESQKARC